MSTKELFRWCNYNQVKGKHYLILSTGKSNQIQLGINWFRAASEEFLGVKFDHKLTFYQHVKSLRKKVNTKCKIKCISQGCFTYKISEKEFINEFLFIEQFNFCPIVWMIHNHFNNNKGKYSHETCPQLIYNYKISSYEKLQDKSVPIHQGYFRLIVRAVQRFWANNNFGV